MEAFAFGVRSTFSDPAARMADPAVVGRSGHEPVEFRGAVRGRQMGVFHTTTCRKGECN